MTLDEIKAAVATGRTVHWSSRTYEVRQGKGDQWLIVCTVNGDAIGLTWRDGVTMNGKPEDFFLGDR